MKRPTRGSVGFWLLALAVALGGGRVDAASTNPQAFRAYFRVGGRHLRVEALSDDIIHFELTAKAPSDKASPIPTSPMVARTAYPGPSHFRRNGGTFETAVLRIGVDPASLCLTAFDKRLGQTLTRICPLDLEQAWKGLTLSQEKIENLYGLGQEFRNAGHMDGDWVGQVRHPGDTFGNQMVPFNGGFDGNTQIPVLYALGKGALGYALFLDNVYKQEWDFSQSPWKVRMWGDQIRFYLLSGRRLSELRRHYLDLVGRPLVPPKKMFGLWVSEYGYRDWHEVEERLQSLRLHHFPVDGFMLDLFWFGGVTPQSDDSAMGRVSWDKAHFPSPRETLTELAEAGIGIIPIEESYVARNLPEHTDLAVRGFLVKNASGQPAYITRNGWWGRGGLIDWTNPAAGDFWHAFKRLPLILDGIVGHWLDLGEPEIEPDDGRYYAGLEGDAHNIFNLRWIESVYRGYQRFTPERRPFMLSRSGTAGIQRYGAAMWSGDIGSQLDNLAAHENAQMHMSLAGIDYYGSDIGGFHREALNGDLNDLYTRWFAAGMLVDTPGRPHTENLCRCKQTSPDRIGDLESNLENLRQRYRLVPYVYSLAHLAHEQGEPVFPPPLYYFQSDPQLRTVGHEKMIGPWLLAAIVAQYGTISTDVYLPRGKWVDFHTGEWLTSRGEVFAHRPLYAAQRFRLPLFARAGALVPMQIVDEKTMTVFGQRTDGDLRDELVVRVYPDRKPSQFSLVEDDGQSTGYLRGALRRTLLTQRIEGRLVHVVIGAAQGTFSGARDRRGNLVEAWLERPDVSGVSMGGAALPRLRGAAEWESAVRGWLIEGGRVRIKSGELPVATEKHFVIELKG